eukprot:evm.model.NODE_44607_length_15938_cov_30.054523.3
MRRRRGVRVPVLGPGDPSEDAVDEAPHAEEVGLGNAKGLGHLVGHLRDVAVQTAVVERQRVGQAIEYVVHGRPDEAGDARLVLEKPVLHVGPKRTGEGELGEEHQHGELSLSHVPVGSCVRTGEDTKVELWSINRLSYQSIGHSIDQSILFAVANLTQAYVPHVPINGEVVRQVQDRDQLLEELMGNNKNAN